MYLKRVSQRIWLNMFVKDYISLYIFDTKVFPFLYYIFHSDIELAACFSNLYELNISKQLLLYDRKLVIYVLKIYYVVRHSCSVI